MGRQHELTVRIPVARTTGEAVAWIKAHDDPNDKVVVDIADDGKIKVRGGESAYLVTSAYVTGRIADGSRGPVFAGAIHQVSGGTIWYWLMGIPAVFLLVCSTASLLFDGVNPGLLFVGFPGALALGYLAWKLVHDQKGYFEQDVTTLTRYLEDFFKDRPHWYDDEDEDDDS